MGKKHNTNQAATVPTPDCRIIEERKPTAPERQLANDCKPQGKMRTIFDQWNEMPPANMPPPPDDVERAIAQGDIPHWTKLTDLLPQLKEHSPCKWYDEIFANDTCREFRDTNPRLIMRLFNISKFAIEAANETAWCCPRFKNDMPTDDDTLRDTREIELLPLSHFYKIPETTPQAADCDEIARKVADAVGGQLKPMLKPIANDAHGAKVAAEAAEDRAEETKSLVKAHLTPRPADYQVTQDQLSGMLKARNCPKDKRTIIRWEKYLKGDLLKGTKPPEGYTLQTRLTINSVKVWLDTYTPQDIGRMKVKVSYEAMTGGRS